MKARWSRYCLFLTVLFTFLFSHVPVQALVTADDFDFALLADHTQAENLIPVTQFRVYDGDTYDLILDRKHDQSIKARILLIDTPELRPLQPFAEEARDRVIELLNQADHIYVEYEGPTQDRYQRDLVHVWVDGCLLQEILVSEGLAIPRYIKSYLPNSKYVDVIYESGRYARDLGIGVWGHGLPEFLEKAEFPKQQSQTPRQNTTQNTTPTAEERTETTPAPVAEFTESTVFVATHSGKRYHRSSTCRGLRNARSVTEMTLTEAQNLGYTACGYER